MRIARKGNDMKFYSPVGKGVSLLKAQGSISYVQSDEETFDMDDEDEDEKRIDQIAKRYADMWWAEQLADKFPNLALVIRDALIEYKRKS